MQEKKRRTLRAAQKRLTLRAAQKRLSVYYPFPVLVLEILSLLLLADTDAGILFPLAELVLRAGSIILRAPWRRRRQRPVQ